MLDKTEKIVSLCKRRGFIFPSSEIYGGFGGVYDFGPQGQELKKNIKDVWWQEMRQEENIVGFDSAILMAPAVWQASGHLTAGFADELVECKSCHKRFRFDELKEKKCPECQGELTEPKKFNLMLKTFVGPVEKESTASYLRAETCQGIFINFFNLLNSQRLKIPFGVLQIGKAFRNEITPKNFIFRTREFEQMELEWFCSPKEAEKWFDFWLKKRLKWYENLGISKKNLRVIEVPKTERAHYAKKQIDLEYRFPFGWREIEGIHNRGDWDLSNHAKHSGEDLKYFDPSASSGQAKEPTSAKASAGKKYFPHIIETSAGVERTLFAFLVEAYQEIKGGRKKIKNQISKIKNKHEEEILLKLDKRLAPIKVAVLPLVRNKPELVKKAKEVYQLLKLHFTCQYDELGSIGRRYRRQDEIGTIFCLTCDFQTLKDDTLTIRERDTMAQERVKIKDLIKFLKEKFTGVGFL
ncbi:MAG: glycine--tRNA ligase [Patescibacteria group bacterium]|nr:glycine--tRNA ligase [Patescibacteria group bacterium]